METPHEEPSQLEGYEFREGGKEYLSINPWMREHLPAIREKLRSLFGSEADTLYLSIDKYDSTSCTTGPLFIEVDTHLDVASARDLQDQFDNWNFSAVSSVDVILTLRYVESKTCSPSALYSTGTYPELRTLWDTPKDPKELERLAREVVYQYITVGVAVMEDNGALLDALMGLQEFLDMIPEG